MQTTQEIFENIYRNKLWGGRKRFWQRFYSGTGSYAIGAYVEAILPLIAGRDVVDLGCGDFSVGRRLVKYASKYIACDIARPVIEHNAAKFAGVDFRVVDAIEDVLPPGDVILIRQVLQHLDNASVSKVLGKLGRYKRAIITEHVPSRSFTPNLDMPTGAGNRLALQSGLVLTVAPFSLPAGETICEVPQHGGIIRTILHKAD